MPSLPARHPGRRHARTARCSLPILLLLFLPFTVLAQGSGRDSTGTGGNHVIQGKIFFPSGRRAEGSIQIKLQNYEVGEISVMADSYGSFTFTSLSPGNYKVVVIAGDDYEIASEDVTIDSDQNMSRSGGFRSVARRYTVMITLQPKHGLRVRPSVINAALAEVPENARTLYATALELDKAGDSSKAIDNLKAAISLYPKFPLALNELGVQYLKLGQALKAVEPLKSAVKLSPDSFNPKLNLGIALLESQQFAEAETQLREALKLNDKAPTAYMYMGIVLIRSKQYDEAREELELALRNGGENLALVHKYLGGLYMNAERNKEAADELEKYLKLDPKVSNADRIRGTIKELRRKS